MIIEKDTKIDMTPALEDYLKVILTLYEKTGFVRVTDIAEKLNVAKPTVCQTISKLTSRGLVTKESYGPLRLTDTGQTQAIKIRYRYNVLKEFMIKILEIDYYISEKEACHIEHFISKKTIEKLESFLNNYKYFKINLPIK